MLWNHSGKGDLVKIQGGAVEEVQDPVVAGGLHSQGAHDTGDALAGAPQTPSDELRKRMPPWEAAHGRRSPFGNWHGRMSNRNPYEP